MPNTPRATGKAARVDDDLWEKAGKAVERMGTDRSTVIRAFLRWYVREPEARLPNRPGDEPEYDERSQRISEIAQRLEDSAKDLRKQI